MNLRSSKQFFALVEMPRKTIRIFRAAASLALALLLVCWICAVTSHAQTNPSQTTTAQTDRFKPKQNIKPGYKIISGDIQVPESYSPEAVFEFNLWPNGVVFYEFDDNVTPANRTAMRIAMTAWTGTSSVVFREGRGRFFVGPLPVPIYIHIQNSTGNSSQLGMVPFGQDMNIASWGSTFIIAHELGHALGLHHEHERPDRDNFVTINAGNIQTGMADQFTKLANGTPIYGPYDFDSVMHYSQCSFSVGCGVDSMGNPITNCQPCPGRETITVKAPYNTQTSPGGVAWPLAIGQRTHLSYLDGLIVRFLYPFGNDRFVDATARIRGANGSFPFPYPFLSTGVAATPGGGTLWIQPGTYTDVGLLNKPMTLRAPLGGVIIRPVQTSFVQTLATVSAASYNGELAVESIAAAFGANLATGTAAATSLPLPTTLAGVTVKITDAAGVERDAPLFFVSPSQINYQVPAGASVGVADVTVYNGNRVVSAGKIPIVAASPGLFSANASGQGVPAGVLLRVRGGTQTIEQVARFDQTQNRFVPVPIDLGPDGDQVFLILFGSGFRAPDLPSAATVSIGGEDSEVLFAGPAPGFAGLDQANVRVPRSLAGKGEVSVLLTADNRSANAVTVNVR